MENSVEIKEFYVGQVVTIWEDGEHFGKQGIIKEISDEDCQLRIPTGEEDRFTRLYFEKGFLK